jgi:hypothetical protein
LLHTSADHLRLLLLSSCTCGEVGTLKGLEATNDTIQPAAAKKA